jgi:catechol 2,3-dioxygenase-like lactoylglutathione lyase family enzyme
MNQPSEPFDAIEISPSFTVSDLQRSVEWYRDVLGFTVDRSYEREGVVRAVVVRAGAVRVLFTQDDGARGERVKGEGFSLQFTTSQDIDGLASRVKAQGWTLEDEPATAWGARVFRLRDPDGFKLVISSPR